MNMTKERSANLQTDIDKKIKVFGFALIVEASEYRREAFTYTVGLSKHTRPEIIVTGLSGDPVGQFINSTVETNWVLGDINLPFTLKNGERMRGRLRKVDNLSHVRNNLIHQAVHRYGDSIDCIQLIWPDENNVLPDEPGYNSNTFPQPLL